MRLVDLFYLITPNPLPAVGGDAHPTMAFHISWMDFVAPLAIGGLWLFYFFMQLRKRPLMPVNDPFFENAIAHGREHH